MVQYKNYTDDQGNDRVLAYSDQGYKIERDGQMWDEADDWAWQKRKYTETDIPIEPDISPEEEQAQKAAAYDIIVGGEQNESD